MIQKAPEIVVRSPEEISAIIEELLLELRDFTELRERLGKANVPHAELFRQHWLIGAMSVLDWLIKREIGGPVAVCDEHIKNLGPHYAKHEAIMADCLSAIEALKGEISAMTGPDKVVEPRNLIERLAVAILKWRKRSKVDG